MALKMVADCTETERGHKAASLALLARCGARVPDAWMWIRPRRSEDFRDIIRAGSRMIILRGSEPLECDPQGASGAYPSQVVSLNGTFESDLGTWLEADYPVIVQCYVAEAFGGAAHIRMLEAGKLLAHLSWSGDVAGVMSGADSGEEAWLGDLPEFGHEAPLLIVRGPYIPKSIGDGTFVTEFLKQMRPVTRAVADPFEVEWIVSEGGELIFLQLIHLNESDETSGTPWIHADATAYAVE